MQEKKNKRLFISLLVLIAVTVIFLFFVNNEYTLEVDKTVFRIEGLETVDKLVLQSDSNKVELAFNGTRWRVNNKYDADRNMITVLMATLREAEPRRPVTGEWRDSLVQYIDDKGIQISIFKAGALVKKFAAAGNASKTQSYFKEEETGNVYLMTIPGYRVYVSGILELDENGWRNKYVFGFNSQNFQGLKAEFPGKPAENFKVSFIDNLFVVEGLPKTDTAKLYTYLDNVLTLTATEYVSSSRLTDSLLSLKPQLVITVTDIAKRDYVLKLYSPQGEEIPGIFNENQAILFDPRKIRPLVRPKSFFALR